VVYKRAFDKDFLIICQSQGGNVNLSESLEGSALTFHSSSDHPYGSTFAVKELAQ